MKKFAAFAAAVALTLGLVMPCVGCGGDTVAEFSGAVSTVTYQSIEEAVKGFLKEEVSGDALEAEFVSYEKEKDLSDSEIEELALGEYAEGLISAEKGTVEYLDNGTEEETAPTAAKTYRRGVYILGYVGTYRFYVPAATEGETLSKSQFSSVFDAAGYTNCTVEGLYVEKDADGTYEVSSPISLKVTEEAIYWKESHTYEGETDYYEMYGVMRNSKLHFATRNSEEPFVKTDADMGDYDSIAEFFTDWFWNFFPIPDHSWFEKTAKGFALRADKTEEFLGMEGPGLGAGAGEITVQYEVGIEDGRIKDYIMKFESAEGTSTRTIDFSEFGSTELTVPDEVNALFADETQN